MPIRAVILLALSSGCTSVWNCKPDSGPFTLDANLTAADVAAIEANWGLAEGGIIACEAACRYAHEQQEEWVVGEVDECQLNLGLNSDETGDATVGSVQCDGTAYEYMCEGRRPLGHQPAAQPRRSLGHWLAECAQLEQASVTAFVQLAGQLRGFGAPAELVGRCEQAAREEREHASIIGALARAEGVSPRPSGVDPQPGHLLDVALHNAVEGCVNESWAALLAGWKASHARSAPLREAWGRLAADELRHAELAWDLHRWLLTQLDEAERTQVRAAQADALAALPGRARIQASQGPVEVGMFGPAQGADIARVFVAALAA